MSTLYHLLRLPVHQYRRFSTLSRAAKVSHDERWRRSGLLKETFPISRICDFLVEDIVGACVEAGTGLIDSLLDSVVDEILRCELATSSHWDSFSGLSDSPQPTSLHDLFRPFFGYSVECNLSHDIPKESYTVETYSGTPKQASSFAYEFPTALYNQPASDHVVTHKTYGSTIQGCTYQPQKVLSPIEVSVSTSYTREKRAISETKEGFESGRLRKPEDVRVQVPECDLTKITSSDTKIIIPFTSKARSGTSSKLSSSPRETSGADLNGDLSSVGLYLDGNSCNKNEYQEDSRVASNPKNKTSESSASLQGKYDRASPKGEENAAFFSQNLTKSKSDEDTCFIKPNSSTPRHATRRNPLSYDFVPSLTSTSVPDISTPDITVSTSSNSPRPMTISENYEDDFEAFDES